MEKNNAALELIEAVDKLAEDYKNIFAKFTEVEDSRFLVHGDYWSNNVMFGENNCKFFMKIVMPSAEIITILFQSNLQIFIQKGMASP